MSLLLLAEHLALADTGNIASGEAIGEPTLTQQQPQTQGGAVIWPWYWTRNQKDIIPPIVQLPEEPEELHRVAAAGGIRSAEAFGVPDLRLRVIEIGGIASGEEFGEPTVKIRRVRLVRRAEEMALLVWRKAA